MTATVRIWLCAQWLSSLLCVNQFVQDNFFGPRLDVIHGANPGHLVGGLELLGDAFGFGHLDGQALHHFIGLAVYLLQVGVQLAGQQHPVEDACVIVPQIVVPHGAVFTDPRRFRRLQVRDQIVAFPMVRQFQHFAYLHSFFMAHNVRRYGGSFIWHTAAHKFWQPNLLRYSLHIWAVT